MSEASSDNSVIEATAQPAVQSVILIPQMVLYPGRREHGCGISATTFCASNGIALKQAAVQGLGVILMPEEFVASELADGTLVTRLPDWQPDPHTLFAVYPFHKEQSRNVRLSTTVSQAGGSLEFPPVGRNE